MKPNEEPGTGFVEETEIVWSRVIAVLLGFALLIGAIYWLFGGASDDATEAEVTAEQTEIAEVAPLPEAAPTVAAAAPESAVVPDNPEPTVAAAAQQAPATPVPAVATVEPTAAPRAAEQAAVTKEKPAAVETSRGEPRTSIRAAAAAASHRSAAAEDAKTPAAKGEYAKFAKGNYTVQPKDTLRSIARRLYGDQSKWVYLADVNPDVNPNALPVEEQIRLPDVPALERQHHRKWEHVRGSLGKSGSTGKTITVHPGETLSMLAERAYGDPAKWRLIADANRDKLADPSKVSVGTELVIPPRPRN